MLEVLFQKKKEREKKRLHFLCRLFHVCVCVSHCRVSTPLLVGFVFLVSFEDTGGVTRWSRLHTCHAINIIIIIFNILGFDFGDLYSLNCVAVFES